MECEGTINRRLTDVSTARYLEHTYSLAARAGDCGHDHFDDTRIPFDLDWVVEGSCRAHARIIRKNVIG